jgi:hypothetical protein
MAREKLGVGEEGKEKRGRREHATPDRDPRARIRILDASLGCHQYGFARHDRKKPVCRCAAKTNRLL